MKIKPLLIVLGLLVLSLGMLSVVYLVRYPQDIRRQAAVPGGVATIGLQPNQASIGLNQTKDVDVMFATGGQLVSSVQLVFTYQYTGATPPVSVTQLIANPDLLVVSDGWKDQVKIIEEGNGKGQVRVAMVYTGFTGYSSSGLVKLVTMKLRGNQTGNINLQLDLGQSKVYKKADASDILNNTPVSGVYTVSQNTLVPTSTPVPGISTPTPTPSAGAGSLVGHWKMDEASWNGTSGEVKDSSGNGNDGVAVSGANTATAGKLGRAGNFDGLDDHFVVPSSNSLSPTNGLTITGWIYRIGTDRDGIVDKCDIGANNGCNFQFYINNNNKLEFDFYTNGWRTKTANTVLGQNQWYFVAATYDLNKVTIYVNGVQDIQIAETNLLLAGPAPVYVGRSFTYYHQGMLDDVRIYNRALSASEVTNLYNSGGTVNPTITPVPINTPIVTATPTTAPLAAVLNFKFRLDSVTSQVANQNVAITFKGSQTINSSVAASANQTGVFSASVNNIVPGTYDVLIKGPGHLKKKFTGISLVSGTNSKDWSSQPLMVGDVDNNNVVDLLDVAKILQKYTDWNVPAPAGTPEDLNFDGLIELVDVALVLRTYAIDNLDSVVFGVVGDN